MMARVLITGGQVLSATGAQDCDVLIDGDEVAALGTPDYFESVKPTCDRVIDASGKYVIPGGVDVHTHMELPFGGTNASDTFETGTIAAAFGGTTSIVDFAVQRTGEDVHDGLAAWHEKADGNCAIDYGFHQIIGGVDDAALKAMTDLTNNEGVTSFKLFMAYSGVFYSDDGQILRAMQTASDLGATIMMHAENGPAIDVLVAQALERGETDPRYHSLTRPVELEEEATHRAIMLAKVAMAPLYIVHVSSRDAVETIAHARGLGANVFAETCPQYLYLSLEEHLSKPGFEGAAYVCSTPLRSRAEGHQDSLWRALRTNDVSVVSTDHCPFCMKDQKELGLGNFSKIPNGIGSVEHRMDLLYQGVVTGEITLSRWVELASTTPARMFGLYPRKGVIAPGSDADIVIYDPKGTTDISVRTHHMNMDHSAYEGTHIDGRVTTVLSRGRVVVENDTFTGAVGHGKFLRRGLSQYLI
jgi:dihydropyrimidinase